MEVVVGASDGTGAVAGEAEGADVVVGGVVITGALVVVGLTGVWAPGSQSSVGIAWRTFRS